MALKSKLIALFVLSAIILTAMAGCAQQQGNNQPADTTASAESDTAAETTELVYNSNIPEGTDYGEANFNIYTYDKSNGTWYDVDFSATEENGEILNDAVYRRMKNVEEKLNIKIVTHAIAGTGDAAKLQNSVKAGAGEYDVAFLNTFSAGSSAQNGYLMDLLKVPSLQIDQSWWDQNCVKELPITGKLYMVTGDIGTMYKKSIGVLLFNKKMVDDYNLDDPYALVADNKWTIEKFTAMCTEVSEDLNGDGKYDMNDKYGLLYYCDMIALGLIGGGINMVTLDEEGMPSLTFYNETTQKIWDEYIKLMYDPQLSLSWSKIGVPNDDIIAMFQADQGLFNFNEFHAIENMRQMNTDFGILPVPLYTETQPRYYHTINPHVAAMMTIPLDCPDLERAAIVLDALGAESKNILTPAYNEVYLKTKGTRDNDSEAILDIVFSTLKYDPGYLYNWGTIGTFTLNMVNGYKEDLASQYAKLENSATKAMEKALNAYLALD